MNKLPAKHFSFVLFLLTTGIILISYVNSFNTSWHLDDEPNILTNTKLHLSSLNLQQINHAIRAHPTVPERNRLYRPLPCLTLALNWYFGQDNVFGYHVVNLAIHILTAWFLFLTLHLLLHIHYKKQYPPQFFTGAALLAALFWALAPIQTQAVTYIVQRMASMATLFTIIAIYTYLRGRTEKKYIWFILCLLSFFAALGSKENAILLPASLFLLEFSFFRHHFSKKNITLLALAGGAVLICGFLFVRYGLGITPFKISNPLSFLDSYSNRSFTFSERILTQPRIVLMYLSQIFLPISERLSIEHDIVLSGSLFSPWTTLPSILLILSLIVSSLVFLKKYPLICFPVLFFFLNHAVESTILQLELIFEHRNYLPSLFLFLPFGAGIAHVLYVPGKLSLFGRTAVVFCTILFLVISGHATYTRNLDWATEGTLWTDAIRRAPNSSRAAHNLGKWHRQFGQYRQAYHYFQLAFQNADKAADPKMTKKAALNGMASVVYMLGNYQQSLQYFNQCLEIDEKDEACLKNRLLAFLQLGQPEKALPDGLKLTEEYPAPVEYQYLTAVSAYQTGNLDIALKRLQEITGRSLNNHQVMHLTGLLLMKNKAYPNSLFFVQQAEQLAPKTLRYQLTLAAAYYANNQHDSTEKILRDIVAEYPLPGIKTALQNVQHDVLNEEAVSFLKNSLAEILKKAQLTP
ncbi:MAG: tetratricopeptide repeat protein [Candidatus Electrothrix sp. YB6]